MPKHIILEENTQPTPRDRSLFYKDGVLQIYGETGEAQTTPIPLEHFGYWSKFLSTDTDNQTMPIPDLSHGRVFKFFGFINITSSPTGPVSLRFQVDGGGTQNFNSYTNRSDYIPSEAFDNRSTSTAPGIFVGEASDGSTSSTDGFFSFVLFLEEDYYMIQGEAQADVGTNALNQTFKTHGYFERDAPYGSNFRLSLVLGASATPTNYSSMEVFCLQGVV